MKATARSLTDDGYAIRDWPAEMARRADGGRAPKNWVKGAIKHPSGLHRALGVPEGKPIPAKKMAGAANSDSPKVRKMAALARTLKSFK